MREIKVRGYSVEKLCADDQWVEGFGILCTELTNGETEYILFTPYGNYEVYGESIGQYTGLKDKNGKEIYEGDILKVEGSKRMYVVCWNEKEIAFTVRYKYANGEPTEWVLSEFRDVLNKFEVIGNIYENHQILEGEN